MEGRARAIRHTGKIMNRSFILAAVLAALFVTGCSGYVQERVVYTEAPPPPREEIIVAAPSAHHAHHEWERGHWERRGRGWVWVGGHWRA
jgi:hypothetical protein